MTPSASRWNPLLRKLGSTALATSVALPAGQALAATKIGVAALIQNQVTGSIGGQTQALKVGSDVFTSQRIQTGPAATAQFLFLDQTTFTIGPQADLVLDSFVYDANRNSGSVVLSTTKGAFRFISGTQGAENYRIKTPVATIGVRGSTMYGAGLANAYIFYVGEGVGWVWPNNKPIIDNILAGRAVIIFPDGRVVMTKFDVVDLGLIRLSELLPLFLEFPDRFVDLTGQVKPYIPNYKD